MKHFCERKNPTVEIYIIFSTDHTDAILIDGDYQIEISHCPFCGVNFQKLREEIMERELDDFDEELDRLCGGYQ